MTKVPDQNPVNRFMLRAQLIYVDLSQTSIIDTDREKIFFKLITKFNRMHERHFLFCFFVLSVSDLNSEFWLIVLIVTVWTANKLVVLSKVTIFL